MKNNIYPFNGAQKNKIHFFDEALELVKHSQRAINSIAEMRRDYLETNDENRLNDLFYFLGGFFAASDRDSLKALNDWLYDFPCRNDE